MSFDELSDLLVAVNYKISQGAYPSLSSSAAASIIYYSSESRYYIACSYRGVTYTYRNQSGGPYYALANPDSTLSSIYTVLTNINSKLSTVDSHISTLNTNMGNGFSSIVSKLDSLISSTSISVGHLNSIANTLSDFTLYLESFHFDLGYLSTISSTLTEINDKLSSGSSDSFDPDFDLPADSDVYDYLFGFSSQLASIKKAITDFSDSYYLTNTMGIDIDTSLITQFLYEHSDFLHLSDKVDTLITGQTAATDTLSANIRAIQCLISTGHDWNVDNTLSRFNSSVTISDSTANHLQGISLYGKTIQANTPSLNNPVDISYTDFPKLDISDSDGSVSYSCTFPISLNGIPVSSGGNYTDSFGQHWSADVLRASSASGTAEIERYVQSISVTGEENWVLDASLSNDSYQTFYCQNIFPNRWDGNWEASFCNYLPSGNAYVSSSRKTCFMLRGSSSNRILLLRLPISVVSSVSDLKALLADFAAAGKPLMVYSVLETPITESVDYSVYDLLFRAPLFEGSTSFSLDTDADMELEYVSHSGATFTAHAYADTVSRCRNCGYLAHVPVGQVADQNLFYSLFIRLDAINESLRNAFYPSTNLTAVEEKLDTVIGLLQPGDPGSSSCDHIYQQDTVQSPTCQLPGLMTSTCSLCGNSYSEILDALGHDWIVTDHVEPELDFEGNVIKSGYDVYTCCRSDCGQSYNDYDSTGAPDSDFSSGLSDILVKLFARLGTLAGKLVSSFINLFDRLLGGFDDLITKFNDYAAQISAFGGDYPTWLGGFWSAIPADLQLALTFAFLVFMVTLVGKKLFFT